MNLECHQKRLEFSMAKIFGFAPSLSLDQEIAIPEEYKTGDFRVRVVYSKYVESVEFIPVMPRVFNRFRLVFNDEIDYSCKFLDRTCFDAFNGQKNDVDEVVIVKNGFVTDTTISNLIFYDSKSWYTPDTYLLNGTMRQLLLDSGQIEECTVTEASLARFTHLMMINALLDFDQKRAVPICNIMNLNQV